MIKFIAGVFVGVTGFWLYQRWFSGGGQVALADGSKSILHGKIVPLSSSGSPADAGLEPKAGYRSREGYEWGYQVGDGDSAGDIARAITGDDGRYQELIGANPHLKTVGDMGTYADKSWEFAPGELRSGIGLLIPLPWSRYIDQMGNPRGGLIPFPEDPRSKTSASVSGSGQHTIISPAPRPVRGDGFSPYGRVVALSEIPQEKAA